MLDLNKLLLFTNTPLILADLDKYRKNSDMCSGRDALILALKTANYTAAVFEQNNLPQYALLAYLDQDEKISISEAQFTTVLLLWSAKMDYPKHHMMKFKVHRLTADDINVQKKLEPYLQLQSFTISHFGPSQIPEPLSKNNKEKILKHMLSKDVPESERCFMTFEVSANEPCLQLLTGIKALGFDLFMPILKGNTVEIIIPSFTLIQTTLNNLLPYPKELQVSVEIDGSEDVDYLHLKDKHPLGISYPGYEKTSADGAKSGRLGFALHDVYHIVLFGFAPHKQLFTELCRIGKYLVDQATINKKMYYKNALETIIDNEFRDYTQSEVYAQNRSEESTRLVNSKEIAVLVLILNVIASTNIQLVEMRNHSNKLMRHKNNLFFTIKPTLKIGEAALQQQNFCFELLVQLFNYQEQSDEKQINLAILLDFLMPGNMVTEEFIRHKYENFHLMQHTNPLKDAFIGVIDQFLKHLKSPELKKNNPWFKQYQEYQSQLSNAVQTNNNAVLEEILREKNYTKFIADIDRIHGTGRRLIEIAVDLKQLTTVQILHEHGAKLTPDLLESAVHKKDEPMLTFLLQKGVDPHYSGSRPYSPMHWALIKEYTEGLKILLNYTSVGEQYIWDIHYHYTGIPANCISLLNRYNQFKKALYEIAQTKDASQRLVLLQDLVTNNQDNFSYATAVENTGTYKLINYIQFTSFDSGMMNSFLNELQSEEELKILTRAQTINLEIKDSKHHTPLQNSIIGMQDPAKKQNALLLIQHGADVHSCSINKSLAVFEAIINAEDFDVVEALILKGAKLNFKNLDKPCFEALVDFAGKTKRDQHIKKVLLFLLGHGLDLNKLWTCLRLNLKISIEIRIFCIENGADLDALSLDESSELITAIDNDWIDYAKFLLHKGADPNVINSYGDSALHIAARKGNEEISKLLREHGAKSFLNRLDQTPENIMEQQKIAEALPKQSIFNDANQQEIYKEIDRILSKPRNN